MRKLPQWSSLLLSLLLLAQCTPSDFDLGDNDEWSPTVGIPLINTTLGVERLLEELNDDNLLEVDPSTQLVLFYRDSLQFTPAIDIGLPDSLLIPVTQNNQTVTYQAPAGARFDLLRLKNTQFGYQISNPFAEAVNFTLTFQQLSNNGTPFVLELTLPAAQGGNPSISEGQVSIDGYELALNGDLQIQYTATQVSDGMAVDLPPFLLILRSIGYSYIEGYFGQFAVEVPLDTLDFTYLDSWGNGEIEFADPLVHFTFRHDIGIPLALQADRMDVQTIKDGILPLDNGSLDGSFVFDYPTTAEVGMEKTSVLTFDKDNSNLVDALSGVPLALFYDFNLLTNPAGNSNLTNHLTDSVSVAIGVEAELPLYGTAKNLTVVDTFEWTEEGELEDVERLDFKLVTDNGFPVEVDIQLYFMDTNEMIFDSLFAAGPITIASAPIDADDFAAGKTESTNPVSITGDRLNAILKETAFLRVYGLLESPQNGQRAARLSSQDEIGLRLGVLATF
jgi:hypothetical protein